MYILILVGCVNVFIVFASIVTICKGKMTLVELPELNFTHEFILLNAARSRYLYVLTPSVTIDINAAFDEYSL